MSARVFQDGDNITRYMGKTTADVRKKNQWCRNKPTKGYVYTFKRKKNKKTNACDIWCAPEHGCTYMYGHVLNHSFKPNCEVNAFSGIVTAKHRIEKGEELTLHYGKSYDYTWIPRKKVKALLRVSA